MNERQPKLGVSQKEIRCKCWCTARTWYYLHSGD